MRKLIRNRNHRSGSISGLVALILPLGLFGQSTATPAVAEEETIVLTPFEVNTSRDKGYVAGSSLSGGRSETPIQLTPASISVITKEFMDDLAITDLREAALWSVNVTPGNDRQNETSFGGFELNFRNTGGAGAYPTRNYFLFYASADSYNTDRFEFSRGPNALLFGDSGLGGVNTNFTKQARFSQIQNAARVQVDSWGGYRSTLDSQYGTKTFAIRFNGLHQKSQHWVNGIDGEKSGSHLATSVRLGNATTLRAEGEYLHTRDVLYKTSYTDASSFWDTKTLNEGYIGALKPIASENNYGLEKFSYSTNYLVMMPYNSSEGLQNWRDSYRTRGTGLSLYPERRSDVPGIGVIPSRDFNVGPIDAIGRVKVRNMMVFLDHKFSENWFAQLGCFWMDNLRYILNTQIIAGDHRIDVNKYLPNGKPNPKVGVAFSEGVPTGQWQYNWVKDFRLLTAYKFEIPRFFDFKQRFSLNVGYRPEHFKMDQPRWRWANNTAKPSLSDSNNALYVRLYWDEPNSYAFENLFTKLGNIPSGLGSSNIGSPFQVGEYTNFASKEFKKITYGQLTSLSTFWKDRVSLMLGVRRDRFDKKSIRTSGIKSDNSPNWTAGGVAVDPSDRSKWYREPSEATSKNLGLVVYPMKWWGVVANYSENFTPLPGGAPKWDQSPFSIPRGEGKDLGLRFILPDNRLYMTLSRYDTKRYGGAVTILNRTEIRNIWTKIGSTDAERTGFDARDTESTHAKGWEVELVANPTPSIRLSANYSRPEITIIDKGSGLRSYFAKYEPEWNTWLAANPVHGERQNVVNAMQTIRNTLEGITEGASNDLTYKYLANFYGTYSFREGRLKGLSLGGGANLKGERKVGSVDPRLLYNLPVGTNPTPIQARDAAFAYLYAPALWEASCHASYEHKLRNGDRLRYQLNVANLFDNQDLAVLSYGTYNEGGLSSKPVRQAVRDFYYLNPRKLTVSVTYTF